MMDGLTGFSFKDGWVSVPDFALQRLLDTETGDTSEEKTYFDCLFELGYAEKPIIELGDPKGFGLEVYENTNIENKHPKYFISYYVSDVEQMRYVVCADYISLLELLAKLSPIVHLAMTTERLYRNV